MSQFFPARRVGDEVSGIRISGIIYIYVNIDDRVEGLGLCSSGLKFDAVQATRLWIEAHERVVGCWHSGS